MLCARVLLKQAVRRAAPGGSEDAGGLWDKRGCQEGGGRPGLGGVGVGPRLGEEKEEGEEGEAPGPRGHVPRPPRSPRAPNPPSMPASSLKVTYRTSLVVQWMGIHLPMQGIQVQSLVREDFMPATASQGKSPVPP